MTCLAGVSVSVSFFSGETAFNEKIVTGKT